MSNGLQFKSTGELIIRQGASGNVVVTYPADLTGYTARFQVSAGYKVTPILNLSTGGSGITITPDTEESIITITATAAQTAAIPDNFFGVYNLEIISAGGLVTRVLPGSNLTDRAVIIPDVAA